MKTRLMLALPLVLTAMLAAPHVVRAQAYPSKPIRLVVPYAAGGGTDFVGRAIADKLSAAFGQAIVVDNRAGANGVIGSEIVAKAVADGYTLLIGAAGTLVVAPHLGTLPFDPQKDLAPVTNLATSPFLVAVNPMVAADTIAELIALAKASPGKLSFGSSGTGGAPHLATELFKSLAGVAMLHVPYKGLSPALTDLLGGQIQVLFIDIGLAIPYVKSGKIKALAVTGTSRSNVLPEVPTVAESGVPGYDGRTWYGLFAPAGTPAAIIEKLTAEAVKALASADLKAKFTTQGLDSAGGTPQQFATFIRDESRKWAKVIKDANIKLE